jgi:hypothetical protein
MRATQSMTLVLLAALVVACESKPKGPTPEQIKAREAEEAASAQKAKDRAWQRMKDCTEATDRAAKRSGWVEGKHMGSGIVIMGWESHYSPKYDRCFARAFYFNNDSKRSKDLAFSYWELFDPFENRSLSTCNDNLVPKASWSCNINGEGQPAGDCAACIRFATDRMEN